MSTKSSIVKVDVYYVPNDLLDEATPRAMLGQRKGFLPVAQLDKVDSPGFEHSKRDVSHPKNLDTIYKAYQVVDSTEDERAVQLKIRSMTYGDAIVYDGVAYYVAADGFVTVDGDEVVPVIAAA